jgi:hypothetical protein
VIEQEKVISSTRHLLAFILIFDLVLGGSGHLIEFGGVSIRLILLGITIIVGLGTTFYSNFRLNKLQFVSILMMLLYTFSFLQGTLYNNKAVAGDLYFGYLTILTSFYFINIMDASVMKKLLTYFRILTTILSIEVILLWLYCFIRGPINVYNTVNPFLIGKGLGFMDVLGKFPRIFFKSAVFIPIGLFFTFHDIIRNSFSAVHLIALIVYALAIICSFSSGFYLFTFIGIIVLLVTNNRIGISTLGLITIFSFLIIYLNSRYGIMDILNSRYSENYNPFTFRIHQIKSLINESLHSPLSGYGFGKEISIDYGNGLATKSRFENIWGELLLSTGFIGLSIYLYHIKTTCSLLKMKYHKSGNPHYLTIYISIIYLCLMSFTNPFMNNAIGLIYYGMCCGIASYDDECLKVNEDE